MIILFLLVLILIALMFGGDAVICLLAFLIKSVLLIACLGAVVFIILGLM